MDNSQFRILLDVLGLSWKGYRRVRGGVKKRILRHMHQLGCKNMMAYVAELKENADERLRCELMMTVSISRFFRDRKLWELLEERILPELIRIHREEIVIWSAGCACGEEVYSLMILWERLKKSAGFLPKLTLFATDINPLYLERAKTATYSLSSLRALSPSQRSCYFFHQPNQNSYTLKPAFKAGIRWKKHDLGSDPPMTGFHLVFLRNSILTYCQNAFKKDVFLKIVNNLSNHGFLVIGAHETIPMECECISVYGSLSYVFRKTAFGESLNRSKTTAGNK